MLRNPLYEAVKSILLEAGKPLRENFGQAEVIAKKTDIAADIVTELDRQTEQFIAERLLKIDPSIAFYGEEHGGNNQAERYWLLDPIDGTGHFVRGLPLCTTMLALIENGQVIFSAINNFMAGKYYAAAKAKGAYCNGQPIHVSQRSFKEAYIEYETDLSKSKNLST